MEEIRLFEAFAGYGSQLMAMRRLEKENPNDIKVVPIGISEIDKYAISAYKAVHGDVPNYGDICKIDWQEVPDFDLFTYSSPCQDFSASGKQAGGEKGSGTRSSLLWECEKAIEIKRPKYLLMENVAALVSKKFIGLFNNWQRVLEGYGYTNFPMVLNAKDYGVPQNRKRVFLLSVLDGDIDFKTPQPMKLEKLLKDVLEDNVDDKYYLSKKIMEGFDRHKAKSKELGRGFGWQPTDGNVVAHAVLASGAVRPCDNFVIDKTVSGWTRDKEGKIVDRHPVDAANCVTAMRETNTQNYVVEPINTDADGCARTIGTQYPSMNLDSVTSKSRDGYGYIRTAVIEYKGSEINEGYLNNKKEIDKNKDDKKRVYRECNETNTREVLRLLWEKIGTQTFLEKIGGLNSVQQAEILRSSMYEKSICKDGEHGTTIQSGTPLVTENCPSYRTEGKEMRSLRGNREFGCSSQGRELSEQFFREFDACLQELSYKNPQTEEFLCYLRENRKNMSWILQQTLFTLEEIRKSTNGVQQRGCRVRKLTPREVFRLMDCTDEDIDKILSSGVSMTQQYKMAGNSIVVSCLYHIFKNLFIKDEETDKQGSLF